MIRGRWTEVSLDWVDYQEARVLALYEENLRLKMEIERLRNGYEEDELPYEFPVPSVLVC